MSLAGLHAARSHRGTRGASGNHMTDKLILPFRGLDLRDLPAVGGKNANLGELIQRLAASGVRVTDGFALTADAFRRHLAENRLDVEIYAALDHLDVADVAALARTAQGIRDRSDSPPPGRPSRVSHNKQFRYPSVFSEQIQ